MDTISISSFIRIQKERNPEDVCRCLFGRVDKHVNKKFVEEQHKIHLEQMSEKWDFDFKNGVPLEEKKDGSATNLHWEKVPDGDFDNIPQAYSYPQFTKTNLATALTDENIVTHERSSEESGRLQQSQREGSDLSCAIGSISISNKHNNKENIETIPGDNTTVSDGNSVSINATVPVNANSSSHGNLKRCHQSHITDYFAAKKRKTKPPKSTDV